jgi:hypothetical protein
LYSTADARRNRGKKSKIEDVRHSTLAILYRRVFSYRREFNRDPLIRQILIEMSSKPHHDLLHYVDRIIE